MNNDKTIIYIGGFELPDKNAAAQRVVSNGKIFKELGYNIIYLSIDKNLSEKVKIKDTKQSFDGFTYFRIKYPTSLADWINYLSDISYTNFIKEF
ncbi:MAG: hypothetical protein LLG05_13540, partial [Porphyromonadaceae bacterium]|nr:hypothetical protein [Porphyromonadaceae bacterium]